MSGRDFWAAPDGDRWVVREEGLPDETKHYATREEAWDAANAQAAACEGEAFLADEKGEVLDRRWHGQQPRDIKPV